VVPGLAADAAGGALPASARGQRMALRRNDSLRGRLLQRLEHFESRQLALASRRAAAVALAVADLGHGAELEGLPRHERWNRAAALLLTRRAVGLRRHAGQWALPGGRMDAGETPEQAALRELAEETGVVLEAGAVLGRLDDFATRSGFVITPVVLWAGAARRLQAQDSEVASIHRIPLAELMRADAPLLESTRHSEHPVLRMPIGGGWIAAPTAALLYQFREVCLFGRSTRVAHFDEPEFAWR
jgi:mutator protein MutT